MVSVPLHSHYHGLIKLSKNNFDITIRYKFSMKCSESIRENSKMKCFIQIGSSKRLGSVKEEGISFPVFVSQLLNTIKWMSNGIILALMSDFIFLYISEDKILSFIPKQTI